MLETAVDENIAKVNEPKDKAEISKLCENLEYPHFVRRPLDTYIVAHHGGILEARISGLPQPEVKWYKNWHLITETSKIKVQ